MWFLEVKQAHALYYPDIDSLLSRYQVPVWLVCHPWYLVKPFISLGLVLLKMTAHLKLGGEEKTGGLLKIQSGPSEEESRSLVGETGKQAPRASYMDLVTLSFSTISLYHSYPSSSCLLSSFWQKSDFEHFSVSHSLHYSLSSLWGRSQRASTY